jgi:hypothetical protein
MMTAPTCEQLVQQAVRWFAGIKEFRAWEDQHLFGDDTPSQLDQKIHRYQLSALMTEGEKLLLGISLKGEPFHLSEGVDTECIEATLHSLHLTFVEWYGDMPQERRDTLFKQLFNDSQPAT